MTTASLSLVHCLGHDALMYVTLSIVLMCTTLYYFPVPCISPFSSSLDPSTSRRGSWGETSRLLAWLLAWVLGCAGVSLFLGLSWSIGQFHSMMDTTRMHSFALGCWLALVVHYHHEGPSTLSLTLVVMLWVLAWLMRYNHLFYLPQEHTLHCASSCYVLWVAICFVLILYDHYMPFSGCPAGPHHIHISGTSVTSVNG